MGQGHGHGHGVGRTADRRWLAAALALIVTFMAVEFVVGLIAGSLALISDAAHMLTDAAAIALALVAIRLAARPAQGGYTYGLRRAEILSAQANGITLLLLAAWFCYEAVRGCSTHPRSRAVLVLVTALVGIVVNVAATWLISRADRTSLNVEGAFQHILNDLYAFIATAIAGLVVLITGFARADALAALVVAGLMIKAGLGAAARARPDLPGGRAPRCRPRPDRADMAAVEGVDEVHDLHIWEITSGQPALSAHVLVRPDGDCHAVRLDHRAGAPRRTASTHTTLQVDHQEEVGPGINSAHCEQAHGPVHRS